MKYDKPSIRRVQVVGEMIHTQSHCEGQGGFWRADKGTCDFN